MVKPRDLSVWLSLVGLVKRKIAGLEFSRSTEKAKKWKNHNGSFSCSVGPVVPFSYWQVLKNSTEKFYVDLVQWLFRRNFKPSRKLVRTDTYSPVHNVIRKRNETKKTDDDDSLGSSHVTPTARRKKARHAERNHTRILRCFDIQRRKVKPYPPLLLSTLQAIVSFAFW